MYWGELKESTRIEEAPKQGTMLIYTQKEVFFKPYQSLSDVENAVGEQEILEIHLFDKEREYRALSSQSRRFAKHYIDNVFMIEEKDKDHIYQQEILLENENLNGKKIRVNSYISYNSAGMAVIDNYQLVEVEWDEKEPVY